MTDTLRKELIDELTDMVMGHFETLKRYVSFAAPQVEALDCLVVALESLANTNQYAVDNVSYSHYQEVREHLSKLETFLQQINQDTDASFRQTQVGEIWLRASQWQNAVRSQFQITADDVWTLIDPVQPDHLDVLGEDVYEARWWRPAPMMDVELLYYTEGVIIQGQPYEPDTLPGGIAVRFMVEMPAKHMR